MADRRIGRKYEISLGCAARPRLRYTHDA